MKKKQIIPLIFLVIGFSFQQCKTNSPKSSKIPSARPTKFVNPLISSGPDPWVIYKDGYYYLCHTTATNIKLYKTKKMSEVGDSFSKVVWTPPSTGISAKNIWAPELHFINGKWYLYYTADDGNGDHHKMFVLENSSPDPMEGKWEDKGPVIIDEDKWAIDGSVFQQNGKWYFIWSGWESDKNSRQNIYIASLKDPWTTDSKRVMISKPELDWEIKNAGGPNVTVNEGPEILKNGNNIFLIYSASGCWTDDYCLGMLKTDSTKNLLDPASWTKSTLPVFTKNITGHAFGPGHNGFFKSIDGKEDWIIYHANPEAGQDCRDQRSIRIQKFNWKSDGSPDFGLPIPLSDSLTRPSGE